jgi:hypothetical protein
LSYKNLIDQKALQAFTLLKDLATEAVFNNSTVTGFDFDDGTIEKTAGGPLTLKLVVIETKKKENTIIKTVMTRLPDTGIPDEFDTLTFEGKTWKVGDTVQDAGRILIFNILREGS